MSGDHSEFRAFVRRILRAYGKKRVADADPEDLVELVSVRAEVDKAIEKAVEGLHAAGYSWGQIGAVLGVSRQAARQRWGDNARLSPESRESASIGSRQ